MKIDCYTYKALYVIPIITAKKIPIENVKKTRRESEHIDAKKKKIKEKQRKLTTVRKRDKLRIQKQNGK